MKSKKISITQARARAMSRKWEKLADARISIEKRAALYWFRQKYFDGDESLTFVSEVIVESALAYPEQLCRLIESHCRYAKAEGFASDAQDLQLTLARIAEQPQYRAILRRLKHTP